MDQTTPLYERHKALGGRMVPFGGFLMPVQYKAGILAEHKAVRSHVGIFDVSHMGEAVLEGRDALANLNHILTNRFDSLKTGSCRYTIMLYEDGGCVDDLIVYRLGEEKYFLVLNASNTVKDVEWLRGHISGDVTLTDISARTAQIAVQGPDAREFLAPLTDVEKLPKKYYTFEQDLTVAGVSCMVSRTGYTGEFGYELYMKAEEAGTVWDALVEQGAQPCGLGARDTLRLEAGMPLYGHEINEKIDPLTAGLNFVVKMDKDFIGRDALAAKPAPSVKRVGLKVTGKGVIREDQEVFIGDEKIGQTTSGTFCPWLDVSCAMAYIDKGYAKPGTKVEVQVRRRRVECEVTKLPFYNRANA